MNTLRLSTVLLTGLTLFGLSAQAQDTLRVNGANSIWGRLKKNTPALEAASGAKIAFVPNNAGMGLIDLFEGRADVAMITPSVAATVEAANKEKPGLIPDASVIKAVEIGTESVPFIVNKANSTARLSQVQVKGILTGKITHWNEVGGSDTPIVVVSLGVTNGIYAQIQADILKGEKIAEGAKVMKTTKDVPNVVAQIPGAIGFVGTGNLTESVRVLETDYAIKMPMLLVTKGEPTPVQLKFIEAAKAQVGGN